MESLQSPQQRVDALYAEGARASADAAQSDGDLRDVHRMKAERLADQAWSLEEQEDLEPRASGLWK